MDKKSKKTEKEMKKCQRELLGVCKKKKRKEKKNMEQLLEILEDICPGVDVAACENFIDGHILESLSIIALIAELEEEFDITIPAVEIIPANFNSAKAMYAMLTRLSEEE